MHHLRVVLQNVSEIMLLLI